MAAASPARKKQRLGHHTEVTDSSAPFQSQPVISHEWTRDIELISCWVVRLPVKKTSVGLRALSNVGNLLASLPATTLNAVQMKCIEHLKRVRSWRPDASEPQQYSREWNQILVCPAEWPLDETRARQQLNDLGVIDEELFFERESVPKHKPWTQEQHTAWNLVWPLSTGITRLPPQLPNKPHQLQQLHELMQRAFNLASESFDAGQSRPNGAVVFEPETGRIVASASDETLATKHPLRHAVMVAIERAAEAARSHEQHMMASAPIHHLLTGYVVLTYREPCVMCSMALAHSRVARVYYGLPNLDNGGLGSRFSVHLQAEINHHFDAFVGTLGCSDFQQ